MILIDTEFSLYVNWIAALGLWKSSWGRCVHWTSSRMFPACPIWSPGFAKQPWRRRPEILPELRGWYILVVAYHPISTLNPKRISLCFIKPLKLKPEQLSALVVVDFTKIGTITTAALNKHCTLVSKVINRNPEGSLVRIFLLLKKTGHWCSTFWISKIGGLRFCWLDHRSIAVWNCWWSWVKPSQRPQALCLKHYPKYNPPPLQGTHGLEECIL